MRAALFCIDIVDKGVDILLITIVVLNGDLNDRSILNTVEVDRLKVKFFLLAIEMLDKTLDAAVKVEGLLAHRF